MYYNSFESQKYAHEQMQAYQKDCREINKEIAKANAIEEIRTKAFAMRQYLRQVEEERKKSTFEELLISSDGQMLLFTRNLTIEAKPRILSNMRNPSLTILRRLSDKTDEIFLYECNVNYIERKLYLNPDKAGKGSYLIKNFALIGGYFQLPSAKAKDLAVQLLAFLIASGPEECLIPDDGGYVEIPDQGFVYIGKEALTWKKALKLRR